MGTFSKKKKEKATPYGPATAAINSGINSAQSTFNANQPMLQDNAKFAQDAFKQLAPTAFGASPFVSGAQKAASNIYSGGYFGKNPGAGTYASHQTDNDPSMDILSTLSKGSKSPGQYDGIGADNPALGLLKGMSDQQVNPITSGLYSRMTSQGYSTANPFVDAIAKQGEDAALKAVNQRFAASGMGEGLSTPYADLASRN